MKIRMGFVSNSSSSSYTCDVTGITESGWDYGLEECKMCECRNRHVFLQKFLPKPIDEIMQEVIEDWKEEERASGESTEEEIESISLNSCCSDDILSYINPKYCPICSLKHIPDYVRSTYLRYRLEISEEELDAEIREKFKDIDEFRKEMRDAGIWEK
jgi:hypothetical protein